MRAAFVVALMLVSAPVFAEEGAAKVSFIRGAAQAKRGDKSLPLKMGTVLRKGDVVTTRAKARVELELPDGSRVRLGAGSSLRIDESLFGEGRREKFQATILLGRVWSKVVRAVGGGSFEIHTKNAVSGVRGTSFTVLAAKNASAIVRVYSGTVGVRKKPTGKADRVEVPGPQEIDKQQWEEIIAHAMTEVRISSLGEISPAQDFEDEGADKEWASWNAERDQKVQ